MDTKDLEQLQKENESLKNDLTAANQRNASLTNDLKAAVDESVKLRKHADVLSQEIEVLKEQRELLSSVNDELTERVEQLSSPKNFTEASKKVNDQEEVKLPTETFEVDGVDYQFVSPVFIYNKQRITAAAALTDKELLEELVAKGSGLIKEA